MTSPSEDRDNAVSRDLVIANKFGIHARPAALIVKATSRYGADVTIEKDGNAVSGKSIMGLMTLEASKGVTIHVTASGSDADKVIQELEELVENRFYED